MPYYYFSLDQDQNVVRRLHRNMIADAFYWHELEDELRSRQIDWVFHGTEDECLKTALTMLNDLRSRETYPHAEDDCSEHCKSKGLFSSYAIVLVKIFIAFLSYSVIVVDRVTPSLGYSRATYCL